jgi:hypothetical protein
MRQSFIAGLAGSLAVLVSVTAAQGAVHRLSITSPVAAGKSARLTVGVSPTARCTIALAPRTSVSSASLKARTGGRITWRWKVRPTAKLGRSPVTVRCGNSGTLRTSFVITAPELTLAAAATAVCARAPARVLGKYDTEPVPLLERTLTALHAQYGAFDCAYGSNYYKEGGPLSYYLVSIARGNLPCAFAVTTRVVWVSDPPLPGYTGPTDETYVETCTSLRASG